MNHINLFYQIKPLIPRGVQISLRRKLAAHKRTANRHRWPIDPGAGRAPEGWPGWPGRKRFGLILQHDVDSFKGLRNCERLMDVERRLGVRSSFNFVLEDYPTPPSLRQRLRESGFEVAIHGLRHDGKLFKNRNLFYRSAARINFLSKAWESVGFTTPSMLRNLDWMTDLDIEYACSTFDTDPFEPQSEPAGTIFPFVVKNESTGKSFVEIPYTLPQDHTLYVILRERDNRIWKEKIDWIAENGGLASLKTHPDYMSFDEKHCSGEEYPINLYIDFLEYIQLKYGGQFWHVTPRDLARFWKTSGPKEQRSSLPNSGPIPLDALPGDHIARHRVRTDNRKVKIAIDLDNTPHVPFFIPIIRELERRGHKVLLSAREAFQVCELADKYNLRYTRIGHHYGKKIHKKILGLFWRSLQMAPFFLRHRPKLTISHGSRSQLLLGNFLRIPSILILDYEHSKTIPLAHPRWKIMPEALFDGVAESNIGHMRFYRGIKEDVYVPEFVPDPALPAVLGLRNEDLVMTVRPPADEAHYRNPESDSLLSELVSRVSKDAGILTVLLPRNHHQELKLRAEFPEWFATGRVIVPGRVVNGLDLLWVSDLVVSGGGTMNREAAALRVPVYSIFRGKTGAVDRMLEKEGRLTMIRSPEEVWSKINLIKRNPSRETNNRPYAALYDIVDYIDEIIAIESVRPLTRADSLPESVFL